MPTAKDEADEAHGVAAGGNASPDARSAIADASAEPGADAGADAGARARARADGFRRVREAHQTEVAEDYVELIAELIKETGEARVVDLAGRLGVSNATVNNTVQRLQRDGLVTSKPYRSIFLTQEGQDMARIARDRHVLVREFLIALGVAPDTAEADAEGIEHHVSEATLQAFRAYLQNRGHG